MGIGSRESSCRTSRLRYRQNKFSVLEIPLVGIFQNGYGERAKCVLKYIFIKSRLSNVVALFEILLIKKLFVLIEKMSRLMRLVRRS